MIQVLSDTGWVPAPDQDAAVAEVTESCGFATVAMFRLMQGEILLANGTMYRMVDEPDQGGKEVVCEQD
jgi:hypothetical protein